MSLGKKLRNLRQKARKTLEEFGEALGVSVNTVYRWEHDKSYPRKYMLDAVAKYYSVTVEWLLSENTVARILSIDENEILDTIRRLPEDNRNKVRGYMDSMISNKAYDK